MEAGNVERTLIPGESGKVLVRPRMRSDHMATVVSILYTVHRGSVVNAIICSNLCTQYNERSVRSRIRTVISIWGGFSAVAMFADHFANTH